MQEIVFSVNRTAIKTVRQFKYLGRILDNNDSNLPAVKQNLLKARKRWGMIGLILKKRKSTKPKTMATFYKVIVQSLLLFGLESWVLSKDMNQKLESFHCHCTHFVLSLVGIFDMRWMGHGHIPTAKKSLKKLAYYQ
jgi:hypothetical protein